MNKLKSILEIQNQLNENHHLLISKNSVIVAENGGGKMVAANIQEVESLLQLIENHQLEQAYKQLRWDLDERMGW